MNTQEYISSGMVESCVLGLASADELAEFERLCAAHSEVRAAREAFERQLEQQLLTGAIPAPPRIKARLFSEIDQETELAPESPAPAPVLPVPTIAPWWRWMAAAALILLSGSTALNYYLFHRYRDTVQHYEELVLEQTQTVSAMQTKMEDYRTMLKHMKDTSMEIVKMPGVAANPSSMATIYWDKRSKDVYLLINELPDPARDKQYQLWAMVKGKPVNAGVFDMNHEMPFVKMKTIPEAEAFAITLEKRGGTESPTMNALYVLGKVTS